jgi:ribosomal protein S24E
MKTKIIKQEKNPFLHREEYLIEIESKNTPSFDEIKKQLGKEELCIVKKINSNFGRHKFSAEVFVYDSKDFKDKLEKIPRAQKKKESQAQEKPAEKQETAEKKQEISEEKKQEKTEEPKKEEKTEKKSKE